MFVAKLLMIKDKSDWPLLITLTTKKFIIQMCSY